MWFVSAFAVWFAAWFGLALVLGGRAEHIAASLQLLAYLTTLGSNHFHFHHSYSAVRSDFWLIDSILLVALYALAIRTTRFWALWITAIQALTVVAHLLRAIDVQMLPDGYYAIVDHAAWSMIALTGIGAIRHLRRTRRYGNDPSFVTC